MEASKSRAVLSVSLLLSFAPLVGCNPGGENPGSDAHPPDVQSPEDASDRGDARADLPDTHRSPSDAGDATPSDGAPSADVRDASPESDGGDAGRDVRLGCPGQDAAGGARSRQWDFRDDAQGWRAGVSDYSPSQQEGIGFESGLRPLPSAIDPPGTGYFLSGRNRSDDLFMFLKRRVELCPETEYRLDWRIAVASNSPSNCAGVGGQPGEDVYLKAGGAGVEPEVRLDSSKNIYRMNVDKGVQSNDGAAASVVGNVANGVPCNQTPIPYKTLVKQHTHATPVRTDSDGHLWLLVGTDSAFEQETSLFYQSFRVSFEPVAD